MTDPSAFPTIFERLKKLLQPYENNLVVTDNTAENYSLNTHFSSKFNKEVFFGAVSIKKNYVSYYLMPIYIFPDLLMELSDGLKNICRVNHALTSKRLTTDYLTNWII